jgi:hypothetical protein
MGCLVIDEQILMSPLYVKAADPRNGHLPAGLYATSIRLTGDR